MKTVLSRLLLAAGVVASIGAAGARVSAAPLDIVFGDVIDAGDGSAISGSTLAFLLSFDGVTSFEADNSISVIDPVDASPSLFGGTTVGDLELVTSVFDLDYDLTLGTGDLILEASTANLTGTVFGNDGVTVDPLSGGRLSGTLTQANVLAGTARIEQAVLLTVPGGTVSVLGGVFADVSIARDVIFDLQGNAAVSIGDGLLDASQIQVGGSAVLTLLGSGFEIDTGSGFLPVGFGALSDLTGTLRGTLASGDSFESSFFQGGGSFTGSIVLAAVPEPSTVLLLGIGLAALAARRGARHGTAQTR